MASLEERELQFEDAMLKSTVETLTEICRGLNMGEDTFKDKPKSGVIRLLRKQFDEDEDEDHRGEAYATITKEMLLKAGMNVKAEEKKTEGNSDVAAAQVVNKSEQLLQPTSLFRRDFRISGSVGSEGKEKLSYNSLVRQMNEGKEKGFKENEIINAVLRAVSDASLRSYLETTGELTVKKLKQVLRTHYKEKTATELYQELIGLKQSSDEEGSKFVIRALDIKQRVCYASREEGELQYNEQQVKKLFLTTVETGLDEDISNRIRPYLKEDVEDVELIHQVNLAEAALKMRKVKTGDVKKKVTVNNVVVEESEVTRVLKQLQIQLNKNEQEMEGLKDQLNTLKQNETPHCDQNRPTGDNLQNETSARYDQVRQFGNPRSRGRGFNPSGNRGSQQGKCAECVGNRSWRCDHCYKCGQGGHMARNCTNNQVGNDNRLMSQGNH